MSYPPFNPDPSGDVIRDPSRIDGGVPVGGTGTGASWFDGAGAPGAGTGANGDYYLDTSNGDVYSKSGGVWSLVGNIKGPTGATGANGTNGTNGTNGSSGPVTVPAAAMTPASTNGATPSTVETTTNKVMIDYLSFDPATSQSAWFPVRFPAEWGAGTVTFQVHWKQTSTGAGGVVWGLAGVSVADNETTDVAQGTEVTVTDSALTDANKFHITSVSAAVTIAGTPAVGELVWFRIARKTADGADTLNEAARLIAVVVTY